jgi:hypothetical protein
VAATRAHSSAAEVLLGCAACCWATDAAAGGSGRPGCPPLGTLDADLERAASLTIVLPRNSSTGASMVTVVGLIEAAGADL